MPQSIYDKYLENEVLSADPVKLVGILYRVAIESVAAARRAVQAGDIRERSRKITKASEIVNELLLSLDHSQGGELSKNLAELYAYLQSRLIEANTQQAEPPLVEVETLLITLSQAWTDASPKMTSHSHPAPSAYATTDETEYVPISATA
jgi:flagellar protein FliS